MKKRCHFTEQERREAVELACRVGTLEASRQLGLSYSTVCMWRRSRKVKETPPAGLEQENIRLHEQVQRLWEANQQLQRTVDYLMDNASVLRHAEIS